MDATGRTGTADPHNKRALLCNQAVGTYLLALSHTMRKGLVRQGHIEQTRARVQKRVLDV